MAGLLHTKTACNMKSILEEVKTSDYLVPMKHEFRTNR